MFLAFLLFGPVLLLSLLACLLARKASHSAEVARGMALLASNLEGQLAQSEAKAEKLAEIARHAIDEAARAAKLKPEEVWRARDKPLKYIAPEVKYCTCNVSIRSDKWPQPCPACGQSVGDILDADTIE